MGFVNVFVWVSLVKGQKIKDISPGHAAMSINNASRPDQGYISFAPLKSGNINGPGKFYSWEEDQKHYKKRGLWLGRIFGLDTEKIKTQLAKDIATPPIYNLGNECATTVHRYLKLGGGDKFASKWSQTIFVFITPDDVEDYAKSIVAGTKDKGSYGGSIIGEGS